MEQLTLTEKTLLAFIREFVAENGYPPSYDEILKSTEIRSKSHISYLMARLAAKGFLERKPRKARSLQLTDPPAITRVPMLGKIAAGFPIPSPQTTLHPDWFVEFPTAELPRLLPGSQLFAVQVEGDSMIDAAILDGDVVLLVHPQSLEQVHKNDMVAAWLVQDETATLKRYVPQADGSVWLVAENKNYLPRVIKNPAKDLQIHGILTSVIRSY